MAALVRWALMVSTQKVQRERAEAQAVIKLTAGRWWSRWLHHSPNEELSSTGRQLAASQGTKKGFPDWILPIRMGKYVGLAMELKALRPYGKAPTEEQGAWLEHFTEEGWLALVCFGAEDAIAALDGYMLTGPSSRGRHIDHLRSKIITISERGNAV